MNTGWRNAFHEKHAFAPFRTQRLLRNFHRKFTRKFQAPAFSKGFSLEMRFLQPFHYFTNRLEEDTFQCKTLKKRRYLDFPSEGFSRWKILSIRYAFCGVRTCLTWKYLRQPSGEKALQQPVHGSISASRQEKGSASFTMRLPLAMARSMPGSGSRGSNTPNSCGPAND